MDTLSATSPSGVLLDLCGGVMLLCCFACLGSKLLGRYIGYYAAQSITLATATGVVAWHFNRTELWVLAGLTLVIKGVTIPLAARQLLVRRLHLERDVALSTGLSMSVILGGVLTVVAYLVTRSENLPVGLTASAVVPISTAIILLGVLTTVLRRHTVAQLIGWLILENGAFLGGITLTATFPFIVEAGVFLDLIAGTLIMLVYVSGVTHQLAHATADQLRELKG